MKRILFCLTILQVVLSECIFYDYLHMIALKSSSSDQRVMNLSELITDTFPQKVVTYYFKPCPNEWNESTFINCTSLKSLNKKIAFATFYTNPMSDEVKCDPIYFTFEDIVSASQTGWNSDSGEFQLAFRTSIGQSSESFLVVRALDYPGAFTHSYSSRHEQLQSRESQVEEIAVDLGRFEVISYNFLLDGKSNVVVLVRVAFTMSLLVTVFFRPQDHSTCMGLKVFKIHLIWFLAFRLCHIPYLILWDRIVDSSQMEWLWVMVGGNALLFWVLLKQKDPNFLYKKLVPLYHMFSLADLMCQLLYLGWPSLALGVVWVPLVYFVLPKSISKIKTRTEWNMSLSIAIQLVCNCSFFLPKKIGIFRVVFSNSRLLFTEKWMNVYLLTSLAWIPLIAILRYSIAICCYKKRIVDVERFSRPIILSCEQQL